MRWSPGVSPDLLSQGQSGFMVWTYCAIKTNRSCGVAHAEQKTNLFTVHEQIFSLVVSGKPSLHIAAQTSIRRATAGCHVWD